MWVFYLILIISFPLWLPFYLLAELFKSPEKKAQEKKEFEERKERAKFEMAVEEELKKIRIQAEAEKKYQEQQDLQKKIQEEAWKRFNQFS